MSARGSLDDACALLQRGFKVIPVPFKQKGPHLKAWQTLRIGRDELARYFNGTQSNIGVLLGEPSDWIVDVDLDHPRAVALADKFLPSTGMTWGRASKPRSHRLYRVTRAVETAKWNSHDGMLVELRSTGCQTIAPGSTNPSGEPVQWADDGEPASIAPDELIEAIEALARAVQSELPPPPVRTSKYAAEAMRRESASVASAPDGSRNDALNTAAFKLGTLIGASELNRAEAEAELSRAASACGLDDAEAARTIASGMDAGINQPRDQRASAAPMNGKDLSKVIFDRPFAPILASELIAKYPDLRPPVIEGLLRQGETMNVVAAPKVGKSWLVHTLAVAVVHGSAWLTWNAHAGRVLLIDAELHRETLAHRLTRACLSAGISPHELRDQLEVWPVRGQRLTIDDINTRLLDVPSGTYALVIFDALYRFLPTDGEENSNEVLTRVYNVADAIADRLGAAVVLVHHSSKGSQAEKAITDVGAGGGAQSRAADTHLILRQHEADDAVVVDAAVRSWPPVAPFVVRWLKPGWLLAPELDPSLLRRPGRRAKAPAPSTEEFAHVHAWTPEEFAREFVGEDLLIRDDIIAHAVEAGMSKVQAESLLRRAVEAGHVRRVLPGPCAPHRFTTAPLGQSELPLPAGEVDSAPPAPEPCAPGGVGGAHAPPPPSASKPKTRKKRGRRKSKR